MRGEPSAAAVETQVLIVGAGPAGMVSALCLAARGVRSLVVERHAGIHEHPKAHELNTRSIEILNLLGITDEDLESEASPESDGCRILFCKSVQEEFGALDLLNEGGSAQKYRQHFRSKRPYLNLSQTELERILAAHVTAEPKIDLRYRQEWRSLEDDGERVVSEVVDLETGETLQVSSAWVLAADGASSRVRRAVGLEMEGPAKLQDFLNVYFEHGLRDVVCTPAKLYWILHPAAPGAFIAHHIDKRWTYNMPLASPWEEASDYSEEDLRRRIHTALGVDAGVEVRSVSTWSMTVQVASAYRAGRVFLVGDSAHRFPPTGGLGMNTGIADAHNLAWKLASVLEGSAPPSLLDSYESERRPVAVRNATESERNYHKIFEVIEAFGLPADGLELTAKIRAHWLVRTLPAALQRLLLRLVHLPAHHLLGRFQSSERVRAKVAAAIEDQIGHFDRIGLDIGYVYARGALDPERESEVDYAVAEYEPSSAAGSRLPHVSLDGRVGGASSHDLVRYDAFTLLLGEDAEERRAAEEWSASRATAVDVVALEEIEATDEARDELRRLCPPGGALLVRPDGHVAWRGDLAHGAGAELGDVAARIGLR